MKNIIFLIKLVTLNGCFKQMINKLEVIIKFSEFNYWVKTSKQLYSKKKKKKSKQCVFLTVFKYI